ncbi:MAG TPA: peptidoglycan-binding domain-containing protein [Chthoniobacteraceae bacterium]|nr:peptidoglycan-binding domain-containing protein [Verrucomicrobiae bacterium]HWB61421.1 peptidoglycan-binding domain-containing protein [Chthoniobacteraceae bacterium]
MRGTAPRVAFNRSNNFGGRWAAASAHPGWNPGRTYFWNNHRYRWFDGGWLIVDPGLWPYGYPYGYPYYDSGYDDEPYYDQPATTYNHPARTAADVQAKLAQMGYYTGDVDGDIGPLSRQAIANYQNDHGLPVSGVIDDQLMQSLGLE